MEEIFRLADLPLDVIRPMQMESQSEGFTFVDRLVEEYVSGANRFEQTGESLFGAYAQEGLIGVCGLNHDPYLRKAGVGRVRHLYVLAAWRRHRVGTQLMQSIIDEARKHFELLTLRTFTPGAAVFYRRIGFERASSIEGATHCMYLKYR